MSIPNCVPEYYREQEEKEQHEYEKMCARDEYYKESKRRFKEAKEKQLPILSFGGYGECWNCKKKFDVQFDEEDDFCTIICYDKGCECHRKGEENETVKNTKGK